MGYGLWTSNQNNKKNMDSTISSICPLFLKKKKGTAELQDYQSYQHHQFLAIVELNQDTY